MVGLMAGILNEDDAYRTTGSRMGYVVWNELPQVELLVVSNRNSHVRRLAERRAGRQMVHMAGDFGRQ